MDRVLRRRPLFCLLGLGFMGAVALAQEADEVARPAPAILVAEVVDDETGEPIAEFVALPGVGRLRDFGYRWQWQPHQIHQFADGRLRWPPPKRSAYSQDQALRVEAEGYLPYVTPTLRQSKQSKSPGRRGTREPIPEPVPPILIPPDGPATLTIRLQRDPGVTGRVVDAEGQPLAGANVAVGMGNHRHPRIRGGRIFLWPPPKPDEPLRNRWERPTHTTTGEDGGFRLPTETQKAWVVVAHPYGFASTSLDDVRKNGEIRLQAWGRIEGQAIWNGQPAAGETIHLFAKRHLDKVVTDAEGRFTFEKVPPGEAGLGRDSAPRNKAQRIVTNPNGRVDVAAGETTRCVLGGRGRPVIGRVTGFDNWRNVEISVHLDLRWPSPSFRQRGDPTLGAFGSYISSPFYRHYDLEKFGVEEDGSFRIENVPAESYAIVVQERDGEAVIRQGQERFRIKLMPNGESDEAKDLGEIEIAKDKRVSSRKIEPRPAPVISKETLRQLRFFQPESESPTAPR